MNPSSILDRQYISGSHPLVVGYYNGAMIAGLVPPQLLGARLYCTVLTIGLN